VTGAPPPPRPVPGADPGVPTVSREERFVKPRMGAWRQLSELIEAAHKRGLSSLDGASIRRLGRLYRAAAADLALARTLDVSRETEAHLNRLCSSAHDLIYAGRRRGPAGQFLRFLGGGFPRLVRETWRYHGFAMAVMLLSGVAAFVVFLADPVLAREHLGPLYARAARAKALSGDARVYLEISTPLAPIFSWGIMANNIQVTLMVFATGVCFGLGAVALLIFNGVSIGGAVAVYHEVGAPELIWTFMAAHGPIELTAIFIAAGAGIRVGLSLILPGRLSRPAAFHHCGVESLKLLGGTAVMLVCAGLLEGFVSPTRLPPPVKWAVGAVTLCLLVWYLGFFGRRSAKS